MHFYSRIYQQKKVAALRPHLTPNLSLFSIAGVWRGLAGVLPHGRLREGGHVRGALDGEAVPVSGGGAVLHLQPRPRWSHSPRQEQAVQGETQWGQGVRREYQDLQTRPATWSEL